MTAPIRVQRKRTKGWKMPQNTIYVGRPSRWGNPYLKASNMTQAQKVAAYESWIRTMPILLSDIRRELVGKNLACWCPLDVPCHADVLLREANR
jgi:hypothetical protein